MLEKTGYKVTVCRNGGEAVKFYTDNWRDIDLIILDLIMPEASGRDTFSIMKRINPRLIVLVSSGYSINSEAQKIIDDGAKGFIQKPYRRTELCQLIEDTLKQYR